MVSTEEIDDLKRMIAQMQAELAQQRQEIAELRRERVSVPPTTETSSRRRGKYLYPNEHNQPNELGIDYPQQQQIEEHRAASREKEARNKKPESGVVAF